MDNNQTLEVKIKAQAEEAKSGVAKLVNGLTKLSDGVQKVSVKVDSNGKLISKTITSINKDGNQLYTTVKKIGKEEQENTKSITAFTFSTTLLSIFLHAQSSKYIKCSIISP